MTKMTKKILSCANISTREISQIGSCAKISTREIWWKGRARKLVRAKIYTNKVYKFDFFYNYKTMNNTKIRLCSLCLYL